MGRPRSYPNDAAKMVAYRRREQFRERIEGALFCIYPGDARAILPLLKEDSVDVCVTSPFYWGLFATPGIGAEDSPEAWVRGLVGVFRRLRRALKANGSLWVVVGTTIANPQSPGPMRFGNPAFRRPHHKNIIRPRRRIPPGYKRKDMIDLGAMLHAALLRDGWFRGDRIIWQKPNARSHPTRRNDHEAVYVFYKSERFVPEDYVQDICIRPPGCRDIGSIRSNVWSISVGGPTRGKHPAAFPLELAMRCIERSECPIGGTVVDLFCGGGTTGLAALMLGATFIGIEIDPRYAKIADTLLRTYLNHRLAKRPRKAKRSPSLGRKLVALHGRRRGKTR